MNDIIKLEGGMDNFREQIEKAKIGQIVTLFKVIEEQVNSLELFAKLSDYGRKKNGILLESADVVPKYGEYSLGTASPCLKLIGFKEDFEIKALNSLGKQFISALKKGKDLDFCDKILYKDDSIKGKLIPARRNVSEDQRLKLKTHMDIIRALAFKFKPTSKPFIPYCGLFGAISYDFIDQFEDLPQNTEDILKDPDYELYFADNLFLTDHKNNRTYFIANALITPEKKDAICRNAMKVIDSYEKALRSKPPKPRKFTKKKQQISTDTEKNDFINTVQELKKHIIEGDIFQVVPSRTIIADYNAEPLDIYKELRKLNPSPYMFFINNQNGILLGSSPEMFIRVQGDKEKIVEIRPIAGTKPRGLIGEVLDKDLDSRYEAELKIDEKELAEHTMLIDLARNDVARISKPGSRFVDEPYVVEKYSHVQHLVSNVRGVLKDDLDALHAYLASMNMGTLTGAPKIEAMKLIRKAEKNKRGFYGGSVGYITPSGDFDSAITIRSMRLKDNKAYIRAGAGIVYDSIPKNEFFETEKKAMACLRAITKAGGFK